MKTILKLFWFIFSTAIFCGAAKIGLGVSLTSVLIPVLGLSFLLSFVDLPGCALGKIILSDFISDIRGKVGGTVYSRNRYGAYRKPLVIGVQPNTQAQKDQREKFSLATKLYGTLTSSQLLAWYWLANSKVFSEKGHSFSLSPSALFTKLNTYIKLIGEDMITDCPDWVEPNGFETFSVDVDVTPGTEKIAVSFSALISVNEKVLLMATAPYSKSVKFVGKDKYRVIAVKDSTFLTGGDITNDYIDLFGKLPETGKMVAFKAKRVRISNGVTSASAFDNEVAHV